MACCLLVIGVSFLVYYYYYFSVEADSAGDGLLLVLLDTEGGDCCFIVDVFTDDFSADYFSIFTAAAALAVRCGLPEDDVID